MTMDTVNGLFEIGGALVTLLSVRQLRQDRCLRGAHWGPTIFFTLWGCWNIIYYPHLSQPFSTVGAVLLVGVNAIYLALMLRFRRPCPFCHDLPMSAGPLCPGHQRLVRGRPVQDARIITDGRDDSIFDIARGRMDMR